MITAGRTVALALLFGSGCGMCVETKPDPPPPVEPPIVVRHRLKDGGLSAPKILDNATGRGPKPPWEAGPDDEVIE